MTLVVMLLLGLAYGTGDAEGMPVNPELEFSQCLSYQPITPKEEQKIFSECQKTSCPKLECREIESLTYAKMDGGTLRGSRISLLGYSPALTVFRNSDLRDTKIQSLLASDLSGSDLRGASIETIDSTGPVLLSGADLRGTRIGSIKDLSKVNLNGAVFDASSHLPFERAVAIEKGMIEK